MFKNKNLKNKIKRQEGFTLIEIIVCMSLITFGMMGVLSLVQQNVKAGDINKNRLIASQLAQEGLELVRNLRDQNWIDGVDWQVGSGGAGSATDIIQDNVYAIDYTGITDVVSANDVLAKLYIDGNRLYRHGAGAKTPFSRIIVIEQNNGTDIEVSCLVNWKRGTNPYSYKVYTKFYNWRPRP